MRSLQPALALDGRARGIDIAHRLAEPVERDRPAPAVATTEVEPVGVARTETHDALPRPADPDGHVRLLRGLRRAHRVVDAVVLAVIRRAVLRPETHADLERVLELLDPCARRLELVPVRPVLLLPAGADPELDATVRHLVDAGDDLRQQRRIAVLRRRDEHAEPDPLRVTRECGEQGPRLETVAVGYALLPAEEVVAHPERLEAGPLGLSGEVAQLGVRMARRGGEDDRDLHDGDAMSATMRAATSRPSRTL